jgi:hypothetical protein
MPTATGTDSTVIASAFAERPGVAIAWVSVFTCMFLAVGVTLIEGVFMLNVKVCEFPTGITGPLKLNVGIVRVGKSLKTIESAP